MAVVEILYIQNNGLVGFKPGEVIFRQSGHFKDFTTANERDSENILYKTEI